MAKTKLLAKQISKKLKGGEVLALVGNLGAGKTTFTKFLAKELGAKLKIKSPTFTLLNIIPINLPKCPDANLYHFDLYRLKNFRQAQALGLKEIWENPKNITVIEWADKIKKYFPKKTLWIFFE